MKRPRKSLDDAERALFREAMRGVTPLAGEARATPPATKPRSRPVTAVEPPTTRPRRPIADGSGVQARTRQRLRRGQLRPEETLDLHGLTRDEAHAQLDAFLARAHASGRRCVLVITGIGRGSAEGGVLRRALPGWLERHPEVLDSAPARPADGGTGACYVLLRRPSPPR
ncbi:MAG: DNA mismatch repair protein MutS [Gammaproteobacteria bacterium]|nr:DNA mismatch repair protein MutS [Gammaproteobacteria bacterium]